METEKLVEETLCAMRADSVPAGVSGLWEVWKGSFRERISDEERTILPGSYTFLSRWTQAVGITHSGHGECVMMDDEPELRKHLGFCLMASGRVLVTGLGLGCVVRGLLANPSVTSIDVVERSLDVFKLVGPHLPRDPRLAFHFADARDFVKAAAHLKWDCAWHDLWSDPDKQEEHFVVTQGRLMVRLWRRRQARLQGGWEMPRWWRRRVREHGRVCV